MSSSTSKIKFRIIACTGEDPEYPATELLNQSPQSKGWQSPRFCDYPQELTLQFMAPVKIKQIQFLSHQCKISSKIELFAFMPDLNAVMPNTDFKWKKLGYLSLDPNERSNFQARELKSVFLDSPALYMKVVFHKCHLNRYNLFNQVGLIALSAYGEPLASNHVEKPSKAQQKYDKIEYQTQFDEHSLQRLKELEDAKDRAVKSEDFEEAKRIKEAIERLKHIGAQLQHLEERKTIAIQNEDYDAAKVIKEEIERLRYAIAPQGNRYLEKPQQEAQMQIKEQRSNRRGPREDMFAQESRPQPILEQPEHEREEVKADNKDNIDLPIHRKNVHIGDESDKHIERDINQPFDEQVIPTLNNNNNGKPTAFDMDSGVTYDEPIYNAEPLTGNSANYAEPLVPFLGEDICRKIFSKNWNAREEGMTTLETETTRDSGVLNSQDPGALFAAVMGAVSYTVSDKIIQVSQKSMTLLTTLLNKPPPKIHNKQELLTYVDSTSTGLLEKIGDNNPRNREMAEECYMQMARHKLVTCNFCVMQLLKNTSVGKHKTTNSTRHVVAKLGLLRQIIREFGINNSEVPYTPVVDYVVRNLENSNVDIRTSASNLIIDIYKLVGDKLRSSLSNLRQNQIEMLEKEFDAVGGGGGGYNKKKSRSPSPEQVITTNINHQGAKNKAKKSANAGGGKSKGPASGMPDLEAHGITCEFCGKVDKNLKDDVKYELHLFKECPMLSVCQACNQTIQISDLNQHLLEECEHKRGFRKCPRCKEAIPTSEFKQHTDEMSCLQSSPLSVAQRCPLCHQDIPPDEMGWKRHLISEGCPNNDRTV